MAGSASDGTVWMFNLPLKRCLQEHPTSVPTDTPTLVPTDTPTLVPTDPRPDEVEFAECMKFLEGYTQSWQSKTAENECKIISSDKTVQKACKKVVKDVLKKGKDKLDSCKVYGWCS